MKSYRQLLALPGAKLLAISSLIARLPFGMTPLVLVLLVEGAVGSYGAAGLVSGAHAIGIGVVGPVQGRLVDRFGQTRVLVPTVVLYAALFSGLVVTIGRAPVPVLVGLAFVAGGAFPPIAACARVAWTSFLRGSPLRDVAYAMDAVIVELAFVCGPLAVAVVLAVSSPTAAAFASAAMSLVGTLSFASSRASRTAVVVGALPRPAGGALRSAGIRSIFLSFGVMSVAFGVVEVGIPAFAEAQGSQRAAGVLLSFLAAGSLIGGLVYGARTTWPGAVATRYRVLLATFGLGLALLPLATSLPAMAAALFLSGGALAPLVICAYILVEQVALAGTVTEAFTWTTTGNVLGTAAGAAMAGVVIDASGPQAALLAGALSVLVAAAVAWVTRATVRTDDSAEPTQRAAA